MLFNLAGKSPKKDSLPFPRRLYGPCQTRYGVRWCVLSPRPPVGAKPRPRQNFRHYCQRQTWLKCVDFLALDFSTGSFLEV